MFFYRATPSHEPRPRRVHAFTEDDMKRSEIYLKAAHLIERNENCPSSYTDGIFDGACDVLGCSAAQVRYGLNRPDLKDEFRDWFLFEKSWSYLVSDEMNDTDAQHWRVTALCFMAAIAEWDEKHS